MKKIVVDIWSDIVCPFCYIGKRKLEGAAKTLGAYENIEIRWRSYQLDPDFVPSHHTNLIESLATRKGISKAESQAMHDHVIALAKREGLDYRFDHAVAANTLDAHRLSHMAHAAGCGDKMEELLFSAFFTEGKNLNDHQSLAQLGAQAGLVKEDVLSMLASKQYRLEVEADIEAARRLRIGGVPFFVIDGKYSISGAQDQAVFVETLKKAL